MLVHLALGFHITTMRNISSFILTTIISTSAFGADLNRQDTGVYAVLGRDGAPTDVLYRFTSDSTRWKAEGKEGSSPWKNISCDQGCDYRSSTTGEANSYLPPKMRGTYGITCIQNIAQAFCKYESLSNPQQVGYVVMALVTTPPTPVFVRRQR